MSPLTKALLIAGLVCGALHGALAQQTTVTVVELSVEPWDVWSNRSVWGITLSEWTDLPATDPNHIPSPSIVVVRSDTDNSVAKFAVDENGTASAIEGDDGNNYYPNQGGSNGGDPGGGGEGGYNGNNPWSPPGPNDDYGESCTRGAGNSCVMP